MYADQSICVIIGIHPCARSEGTFSLIELMVVLDRQPDRQDVAQIDVGLVELYGFRPEHRKCYDTHPFHDVDPRSLGFVRALYEVDEDGPSLTLSATCNVVIHERYDDPNPLPPPSPSADEGWWRYTSYVPGLRADYSDFEAYKMIAGKLPPHSINCSFIW